MRKAILPILVILGLIVWGIYHHTSENTSEQKNVGIKKGDLAPNIQLPNLKGKTIKLSDFRGKTVLVNFWATWCKPCKKEIPALEKYYKKHRQDSFTILSINATGSEIKHENVPRFLKKHPVTFPVVLDKKNKYLNTYEITGLPTSYFIKPDGTVFHKSLGPLSYDAIRKISQEIE